MSGEDHTEHRRGNPGGARSAARLAAVQALYQMELGGASESQALEDFIGHYLKSEYDERGMVAPDRDYFAKLVRGVTGERGELAELVSGAFTGARGVERMDRLMRLIVFAGAWELWRCPDVPTQVAINEWVEIARAFFDGNEPGIVNGVLDPLARRLRDGDPDDARHAHGGR
jgi:N utilization substance protein B